MKFSELKPQIEAVLSKTEISSKDRLTEVCEILQGALDYYNWVGFYFANQEARTLHLEAFAGEPTDHTVIPFGKGICGQVAESNENFVVPDVNAQDNYIACSIFVKSEIVVPLFKDGNNIGQIDIDSHSVDPFSKEDEDFLEWVNKQVAKIL